MVCPGLLYNRLMAPVPLVGTAQHGAPRHTGRDRALAPGQPFMDTPKLRPGDAAAAGRQTQQDHLVGFMRHAGHAVEKEIARLDEVVEEFGIRGGLKAVLDQALGVVDQAVKSQALVAQDGDEAIPAAAAQHTPGGRGEPALDGMGGQLAGIPLDLAAPGVAQQPIQAFNCRWWGARSSLIRRPFGRKRRQGSQQSPPQRPRPLPETEMPTPVHGRLGWHWRFRHAVRPRSSCCRDARPR